MFKKYKSEPSVIEAVQFTYENKNMVFNSLTGQHAADFELGEPIIKITTIHGEVAIVRIGDWIVKESKLGFYYPIKNNIFLEKYRDVGLLKGRTSEARWDLDSHAVNTTGEQ